MQNAAQLFHLTEGMLQYNIVKLTYRFTYIQMRGVRQIRDGLAQLLYRHHASERILYRFDEVAIMQHGWLHRAHAAVSPVPTGHLRLDQH